ERPGLRAARHPDPPLHPLRQPDLPLPPPAAPAARAIPAMDPHRRRQDRQPDLDARPGRPLPGLARERPASPPGPNRPGETGRRDRRARPARPATPGTAAAAKTPGTLIRPKPPLDLRNVGQNAVDPGLHDVQTCPAHPNPDSAGAGV